MTGTLEVLAAGRTRVTDLGRAGARWGFSDHGALDETAARAALALVGDGTAAGPAGGPAGGSSGGSSGGAALLEVTALPLRVRPDVDVLLAATGAVAALRVDGHARAAGAPQVVAAGSVVELVVDAAPGRGLRAYLAVAGGLDVPAVLGSHAPEPVLGLPGTVADRDRLGLRTSVRATRSPYALPLLRVDAAAVPGALGLPRASVQDGVLVVPVTAGPDAAAYDGGVAALTRGDLVVTDRSDEVGLRLAVARGEPLPRARVTGEVRSIAVPVGGVEIPTGGTELLVLHRGRGVTAGYRIPAVVTRLGLDLLAQAAPGRRLRLAVTDEATAVAAYRARRHALDHLTARTAPVLAAQLTLAPTDQL